MGSMKKITFAIALGFSTCFASVSMAQSVNPNFPGAAVTKLNGQGFRACKALGDTGYTAIARGILGDGGGGDRSSGFRNFQVRFCFKTRGGCENFISRIHHHISQIDLLRVAKCSARS